MKIYISFLSLYFLSTVLWLHSGSVEAIIGGKNANLYQFKYMVAVLADDRYICGGAILDKNSVLTAAHCVIGEDNKFLNQKFTVLARVVHLMLDNVAPIEVNVNAIFVPKDFEPIKRQHGVHFYRELGDLAILKLKNSLPLGEDLTALDLPKLDNNNHYTKYVGSRAILTGFGIDTNPIGGVKQDRHNKLILHNNAAILKYAEVIIQHKHACKSSIPFEINDKHLFALVDESIDGQHKGACIGDDGSPLVIDGTVIGVLAQYQRHCNEYLVGSVYTRTSAYIRYIKNSMKDYCGTNSRYAMYKEIQTISGQTTRELIEIMN